MESQFQVLKTNADIDPINQSFSTFFISWHMLIYKILWHTKKYIFCQSDKINRYNSDSFTLDGYCWVGVVIFSI